MSKECFNCKCEESESNPLMPEEFYKNLFLCHNCRFSEEIKQWRVKMEQTDPLYRRYVDLITAGFKMNCPSCGKETNRNPKFIGHSPVWELCCTKCSEVDYKKISPYKYDLTKWHELYDGFIKGKLELNESWGEILELEKSSNIPKHKCKCGGEFSMVAKPRCLNCKTIVINSIFHVCDGYYA